MIIDFLESLKKNKSNIKNLDKNNNYINIISFLPYVFSNLKDIDKLNILILKEFNLEEKEIEKLRILIYYLYFQKERIDEKIIFQYLIEKFSLNNDFDFSNYKEKVFNILNDKEKKLIYLKKREQEKEFVLNFMKYKDFFEKKEIVKWLATNNRKTDEYYADYGLETNELIKFVKSNLIIDYDYQKTIKILKVDSFEKALKTPNILLVKAILSSIILRERFGIGTLSRAIKDGIVFQCLEYIEKYYAN